MRFNDCTTNEGYVALQAWLCGQMSPRAPHAADLFAQDRECLYDVFLSMLVGTGMGFDDFDDDRTHHGLYAFDFFVGDIETPPRGGGVEGARTPHAAGQPSPTAKAPAMCHALVDTWLGETGRRIPFVASVIASVATLELVADVSVDECVFECDLPPGYARSTANKPWEDGSLPIGALDLSLVRSSTSRRARDTRDRPCPSRASTRPWLRPCRWGSLWSPPRPPAPEWLPLCAHRTGVLRCSGGLPTQWLEPCQRAGTSADCTSAPGWATHRSPAAFARRPCA